MTNFVESTNRFNPLLADLPRLKVRLASDPIIELAYTTSAGNELSYATSETTGTEYTKTDSNSLYCRFATRVEAMASVQECIEFFTSGSIGIQYSGILFQHDLEKHICQTLRGVLNYRVHY